MGVRVNARLPVRRRIPFPVVRTSHPDKILSKDPLIERVKSHGLRDSQ
jgi:hypothetical protein